MTKISVALSGGGHRASLFGLGALQYLADAGKNEEVVSISSVSGGSLTNAFVGQNVSFGEVGGDEFEAEVTKPFVTQIATRGTLFAPPLTKVYLAGLILVLLAALIVPWFITALHFGWRILLCLAGLTLFLALAWLRGAVVRSAFRTELFSSGGKSTRLVDMHDGVDHVLCSTDLQSGDHFYFTRDMAYGYQFGLGVPADVDLAIAAGASAALPGAFTPVAVDTAPLRLAGGHKGKGAKKLHLVDGGVYDNMGDQWAVGYGSRRKHLPERYGDRRPEELVVVNASSGAEWTPTSGLSTPITGELKALGRDKDILYDNTTAHRRTALIERFRLAQKTGKGLGGTYVGVNQSPYRTADAFKFSKNFGERAQAVLAALDASGVDEKAWDIITEASDTMSTNLSKIDAAAASDLVWHAYVVAMCNLHVVLDYPLLPIPDRSRFRL